MKHIMGPNSKSLLTNVKEGDVQPNAVDLRLGKVFKMSQSTFMIDERDKKHRGSFEMQPDNQGYYNLPEGHYEVIMENMIVVGENEAGWVITRSTLNRNGVFLTSGLYDSGYDGVMAGVMHVTCGPMRIQRGTRIGQYLSFNAESLHQYKGSYGKNTEHDKKYQAEAFAAQQALEQLGIPVDEELKVEEPVKRGRGRPPGTTKKAKE